MNADIVPGSPSRDVADLADGRRLREVRTALLIPCLALGLAACTLTDDLLTSPSDPNTVDPDAPVTLRAAMAGATADFFFGWDVFVTWSGVFSDELFSADVSCQGNWDCRRVQSNDGEAYGTGEARDPGDDDPLYSLMQKAVRQADQLRERILAGEFEEIPADGAADSPEFARLSLFSGVSKFEVATLMCTAAFNGTGPELSTSEVYEIAADEFTRAIEAANAEETIRQAALVGRARMRLWLGDEQGALADARAVDPDHEFLAEYSTNTFEQRNRVWHQTWNGGWRSIFENFRDLTIDDTGEPDPRVRVSGPMTAFSAAATLWAPLDISSGGAPLTVTSGDEAQYIIAEIVGGDEAVEIINEVRDRHGIDVEWEPAGEGPNEIRDKVIDERRRTLFLAGIRTYDSRRYLEKFGLDFFQDTSPQGFTMGDQTCAPLPDVERNNNQGI